MSKYIQLYNLIGGNFVNLIIHISGASCSGKTTLGNKLQEKYGNKISY
jgi:uridine kinase